MAPGGSPNAGNLIVGNLDRLRVQEYSAEGAFVRAFGWDVDATNPSTGFEICTAESGDTCKNGSSGAGVGQFSGISDVAEDSTGAIYAISQGDGGRRVQKFTPAGGSISPLRYSAVTRPRR